MASSKAIRPSEHDWRHAEAVVYPALMAMPETYVTDLRRRMAEEGVQAAVAKRDTPSIFNWLLPLLQLQGISDAIALSYLSKHGGVCWADIEAALTEGSLCPKLTSYWHFSECGFRKATWTCAEPRHLKKCPLPSHPLRKGVLNQAAYSLFFFMRDICDRDFVGWIDARLEAVDTGAGSPDRERRMRDALLNPLRNVVGISDKLCSMLLSVLLLGADPTRERWVSTGASLIAIDTLVHAFMHRTGILRRFDAEHAYGAGCYRPGGCADIIEGLARRIDAREFGDENPSCFPRFIQHAIWCFCSDSGLDVCNGNRVDRRGCTNWCCPVFDVCDRLPGLRREPSRNFDVALSPHVVV